MSKGFGSVLVVGGAGYIGGAVTDLLLERGIPFTVYDNLLYEPHYLKPVSFINGDVRQPTLLKEVLRRYENVIWLAALVGDGACAVRPQMTTEVNLEAVRWLSNHFSGRIVFTSTCSVYGEHHGEVDETGVTNPLSLYAETKLEAESYLQGENSLIFRLGTAFGISDTYSRPRMDLVANQMPVAGLLKGKVTVNGGDQWRPMVHVYDIAEAIVNNLYRPVHGVYNLASVNLQMRDLAAIVAEETGCEIETVPRSGDARDYRVSTAKAVRDNIFNPNTLHTINYGVRQFKSLICNGRVKNTDASVYFNVRHVGGLNSVGKLT